MLQERFMAFSHDTIQTGTERVADANKLSDDLINIGHSDADQIAKWKDMINEAWEELVELISTREEVSQKTRVILGFAFPIFSIKKEADISLFIILMTSD